MKGSIKCGGYDSIEYDWQSDPLHFDFTGGCFFYFVCLDDSSCIIRNSVMKIRMTMRTKITSKIKMIHNSNNTFPC